MRFKVQPQPQPGVVQLLDSAQASLLDEAIDADIAAIEAELQTLAPEPLTDAAPR